MVLGKGGNGKPALVRSSCELWCGYLPLNGAACRAACDGGERKGCCRSVLTAEMGQCWISRKALEETMLEDQKFVSDCAQVFLQRDALHVFLVSFLTEADASGLPLKRSLAERQEGATDHDMTPKRGTGTQQASGLGALSF